MTIIEKVAKAIAGSYDYIDDERAKIYAKAAIEAMKEPSEETIDYCALYASVGNNSAKEVIEAYINTALDNK